MTSVRSRRLDLRLRVLGLSLLAAALPAASMAQHVDLDVKLGPNSRLTFVGGGPVPVPVVLGRRSGNTCVPIGASDEYRIRVRAFPDLQDPEPGGGLSDDRAPFRICNAGADPNSAGYCANGATPVAEATLRQEDGVARLAVTSFDLPEGFCTTAPGQGTDQFFF